MKETIQDLITRRSCKAYSDKPVPEDLLSTILEAGTYAPTGRGLQSPVIVAVENKETRDRLSRMNAAVLGAGSDPFYGAPVVLVVLADHGINTCVDDGNMVIANLLHAAHALGVDSCYVYRAREVFDTKEGKELLREWGIQGDYIGIGNVILGYGLPGGIRPSKERKPGYVVRIR